jgi:hypothetical protein
VTFLVWIPGIVMDIEYIKVRGSSMREGQPIHDTLHYAQVDACWGLQRPVLR